MVRGFVLEARGISPVKAPSYWPVDSTAHPFEGRETWLEVTKLRKVPRGFAGIIVRTKEAGGWCADKTWAELQDKLSKLDADRTILDVGFSPEEWSPLREQFAGTVIGSQLFGFSEFGLPTNLLSLLQQLNETHLIHHNNNSVASYPLSEGLERLISGTDWWRVSDGWLREDNPSTKPAPWGSAALQSIDYTRRFGSVESFLAAYQTGHEGRLDASPIAIRCDRLYTKRQRLTQPNLLMPTPVIQQVEDIPLPRTIVTPPERSKEPIAIVGMGCRLPKANSISRMKHYFATAPMRFKKYPSNVGIHKLFWDADPKAKTKPTVRSAVLLKDLSLSQSAFESRQRSPPKSIWFNN